MYFRGYINLWTDCCVVSTYIVIMQMFYRMLLISKISLQPDEYFELLEEKNTLLSVHLETQILSYRLSRKDGVLFIEII